MRKQCLGFFDCFVSFLQKDISCFCIDFHGIDLVIFLVTLVSNLIINVGGEYSWDLGDEEWQKDFYISLIMAAVSVVESGLLRLAYCRPKNIHSANSPGRTSEPRWYLGRTLIAEVSSGGLSGGIGFGTELGADHLFNVGSKKAGIARIPISVLISISKSLVHHGVFNLLTPKKMKAALCCNETEDKLLINLIYSDEEEIGEKKNCCG